MEHKNKKRFVAYGRKNIFFNSLKLLFLIVEREEGRERKEEKH